MNQEFSSEEIEICDFELKEQWMIDDPESDKYNRMEVYIKLKSGIYYY